MKNQPEIREEDIQRALSEFFRSGGHIQQLPDAKTPQHNGVGTELAMFETLSDLEQGQWRD